MTDITLEGASGDEGHWVGTWAASPQLVMDADALSCGYQAFPTSPPRLQLALMA